MDDRACDAPALLEGELDGVRSDERVAAPAVGEPELLCVGTDGAVTSALGVAPLLALDTKEDKGDDEPRAAVAVAAAVPLRLLVDDAEEDDIRDAALLPEEHDEADGERVDDCEGAAERVADALAETALLSVPAALVDMEALGISEAVVRAESDAVVEAPDVVLPAAETEGEAVDEGVAVLVKLDENDVDEQSDAVVERLRSAEFDDDTLGVMDRDAAGLREDDAETV